MPHRKDLDDQRDPNPDKDRQYSEPDLTESRVPDRSFPNTNIAADQRRQAAERNSGDAERGNRSDDVQASDRSGESALVEGGADDADRAQRANTARTSRDVERREETDPNNTSQNL